MTLVEREGAAELAGRLVPQIQPEPTTAATDALMDRLRSIAAAAGDP